MQVYCYQENIVCHSCIEGYHLTKARLVPEYVEANIDPKTQKKLHLGRLHISIDFEQAFLFCRDNRVSNVAVILCGPSSFYKEVEFLCRQWSHKGVNFDLHSETFAV